MSVELIGKSCQSNLEYSKHIVSISLSSSTYYRVVVLPQTQTVTSHLGVQDLLRGSSFLLSLWARWVLCIKQSMKSHPWVRNPLRLHYAMVKDSALHSNLGLASPSAFDFVFWHFPRCSLISMVSSSWNALLSNSPDFPHIGHFTFSP